MIDYYVIEQLIILLECLFFNRKDKFSVMAPWGNPCPAVTREKIRDLLRFHVGGPEDHPANITMLTKEARIPFWGPLRMGTYFPDPEGKVCVACIDFDDHMNKTSLADPFKAASDTAERANDWLLNPYLELSGGGRGVHLWIFFPTMLWADLVRNVLLHLIPDDLELVGGGVAVPRRSIGVEVFPKSSYVADGGVGSAVWLPFWHGAEGNATQFFRFGDDGELEFYIPEELKMSHIPADLITFAEDDCIRKSPVSTKEGPMKSEFQAFRIEAIHRLDLKLVYGDYLTGWEPTPGYLECRDPWSESGDGHPSASVQTGEYDTVRGRFHSFIRDEGMSVFDFLAAIPGNGINNFGDALRHVSKLSGVPLPGGRA